MSEVVVINGVVLTKAQEMTLETALSCFRIDMKANVFEDKALSNAYFDNAIAVEKIINSKMSKTA